MLEDIIAILELKIRMDENCNKLQFTPYGKCIDCKSCNLCEMLKTLRDKP